MVSWPGSKCNDYRAKGDGMASDHLQGSDTPLTNNTTNWLLIDLQIVYDIVYVCMCVCMCT